MTGSGIASELLVSRQRSQVLGRNYCFPRSLEHKSTYVTRIASPFHCSLRQTARFNGSLREPDAFVGAIAADDGALIKRRVNFRAHCRAGSARVHSTLSSGSFALGESTLGVPSEYLRMYQTAVGRTVRIITARFSTAYSAGFHAARRIPPLPIIWGKRDRAHGMRSSSTSAIRSRTFIALMILSKLRTWVFAVSPDSGSAPLFTETIDGTPARGFRSRLHSQSRN